MSTQNRELNTYEQFLAHILIPEVGRDSTETDAELLKLFKGIVPQEKFGEVSITTALPEFRKQYNAALQSGKLLEFLAEHLSLAEAMAATYIARANPESLTAAPDQKIHKNHQPEQLSVLQSQLVILGEAIESHGVSEAIKQLYRQKVSSTEQFIKAALELGKPGFTREQQSIEGWLQLIDAEATVRNGQVTLPYEGTALAILEKNTTSKDVYPNVLASLDTLWKLSDHEKAELGYETLTDETKKLTPEQGKKLFELILARVGLTDWVVEWSSSSAIDVNAPSQKISFPKTRELTGDDIAYVLPHEFVHALRGVNGAKQDASILGSGMENYLATEEGLATLSEMIVGQPFGHRRQTLFAARYWAVAQSLKVEIDPQTETPRAQFTMQEIYNKLLDFHISVSDATEIVWRISRGTSLSHEVVDLDLNGQQVQVAETFTKDAVYFVGQMMMFNVFKEIMPLLENENSKNVIQNAGGFDERVLARIGRAIVTANNERADVTSMDSRKEVYEKLVLLGREALLALLQYFIPGKMTLEALNDPEWLAVLTRENLVQYRSIFETPTEEVR